jgi:D-alanyl-D-alanine carboxypeptidase
MSNTLYNLQKYIPPELFFWAALLCIFLFPILPSTGLRRDFTTEAAAAVFEQPKENPYQHLELTARAAHVFDVRAEKTLFSKNAREPLPLASIAKIMTAVTALSFIPETTYVTVSERAIAEEGDSGLKVGERWLLRDLLKFMLIESSNDGAAAISTTVGGILATSTGAEEEHRRLFIERMNEMAGILNFSSTRFFNESGLDLGDRGAGAYGSAAETSEMLAYALSKFPFILSETRWSELTLGNENGDARPAKNTNTGVNTLPLLIASKTGYTDLAGGNLVIAFDAGFNYPIIISVLGSTIDDRFTDVEKLLWATLKYLASQK